MDQLKKLWDTKPYMVIMVLALALRIVAVVFAKGYGMHDDHFSIIEASQSWVDGSDYNNWLPKNQVNPKPDGHSFFYVGLHYVIFSACKLIGFTDPNAKMYFIRLLHALLSLVVVSLGYKITERLYNTKTAKQVGLLLAALWFMPFLSVRNLVEIVATPILMVGIWMLMNADNKKRILWAYFFGGLVMGLAFSVRFQTIVFIGGVGLAILIQKKWKEAVIYGVGALFSMAFIQSIVDMFIWHRPFAELTEYVVYNIANKDAYGTRNFLMYFELVPGMLIPPIGLFIFIGFFFKWKKHLLIFLPSLLFFAFHTVFPNKQERFIFTIVPLIIMLGMIGWNDFVEKSGFWSRNQKLLRGFWVFFWVVNIILLSVVTTTYSKKARVESMLYLSKYKTEINSVVIEETQSSFASFVPVYYLGKWISVYKLSKPDTMTFDPSTLRGDGRIFKRLHTLEYFTYHPEKSPQYILFIGEQDLQARLENMKKVFPALKYETTVQPGYVDRIMLKLNPTNQNQPIIIYKTGV
jgi:hypothetical protein